jgi:hypothetical protein
MSSVTMLLAMLVPGLWQAGGAAEPPLAGAQAAVDRAADAFRGGDFEGALRALTEAEPIALATRDPALATIRFNIARCHEELGQSESAWAAYERYLGTPDEPHRKERAWSALRTLEARLFGGLSVSCQPSTARVGIAGAFEGTRPCPLDERRLRPGTYRLEVQSPGYLPAVRTIEVQAGAPAMVDVLLVADTRVPAGRATSRGRGVWPWLALGTSVAAAGAGAWFTTSARDARTEAESLPPSDRRSSAVDRFHRDEGLSWVAYGTATAAFTAALALWFWPESAPAGESSENGGGR